MTEPKPNPYTETHPPGRLFNNGPDVTDIDSDEVIFELTAKRRTGEGELITIARPDRLKVRVEDDTLVIASEHPLAITMTSLNRILIRSRFLLEVE